MIKAEGQEQEYINPLKDLFTSENGLKILIMGREFSYFLTIKGIRESWFMANEKDKALFIILMGESIKVLGKMMKSPAMEFRRDKTIMKANGFMTVKMEKDRSNLRMAQSIRGNFMRISPMGKELIKINR